MPFSLTDLSMANHFSTNEKKNGRKSESNHTYDSEQDNKIINLAIEQTKITLKYYEADSFRARSHILHSPLLQ